MKCGVLFDFDDTLVETTIHFNAAKEKFAGIMSCLDFPAEEALEVLNRNDIRNVRQCGGFFKECFPRALGETYEYYCKIFNREMDLALKKEIEDLGWQVYEQPAEPVKDAGMVLESLQRRYPLYLATRGELSVQEARLEQSGLARWFKKIYVLSEKNCAAYRQIALEQRLTPQSSWVVGNSMKSDVNPALRAGFKSIYIYHPHTWDYEDEEPIGGHVNVDSLLDVLSIIC
ncbi:HAD hydrolase-like protein [Pelotomaculum propionicicum]|uniref:HAD hydrolase-like protein n=1 Tax=Pelotomaculum propionicicum TaxID=258475 RepID=UPI003B79B489